jgi:hypothetical protein
VKFGFSRLGLSPRWYAEVARTVEELGFASIAIEIEIEIEIFPLQ